MTQKDLISLAEPFGALSSVVLEKPTMLVPPSARIEYAECFEAARAVSILDNKVFQSTKLTARLDLRAVESGVGLLLSRKVKISWYAPSIIAWAHYPTINSAKAHATKLDGRVFDGRNISASFQIPSPRQTKSFSVEIKGLHLDVEPFHLGRFCGSSSVKLGSPSYNREEGIKNVRLLLGTLDSFDVLPADKTKAKVTAFAQFSSAESAAAAVKNLHGAHQPFVKNSPLWLEQVHSVKYNLPVQQFATLKAEVDRFRNAHQNECKIRYYDRNENGSLADPVCVRIYSPDPQALGHTKIGLETLLQGELLVSHDSVVWDEYFESFEGEGFLQSINKDSRFFVKVDTRARNLRIFGPEFDRAQAKDLIFHQLADILLKRHIIPLKREVLRALLTGGLNALQGLVDAENISLDVVARTLTVRGNTDEVDVVRRALDAMQTSLPLSRLLHNGEAVCPVCFCEVSDPIGLTCGHVYCTPCLQHFLRSSVGPKFNGLRCVAEGLKAGSQKAACSKEIPYSIVRRLLSSTDENQLLEASFLAHIHSRPKEFHFCPTPDCKVVYRPTGEGTALRCSVCLNRICGACHVEFHEGLTCAEHRDNLEGGNDAFRQWKEANGVKPCPKCRADLEKAGGCNHMTCIRCGTHICWVCMDTFSDEDSSGGIYQHLRQKHGGLGIQ
jgi:IBR domain, a half RING-finger domain/RING-type zinc-finger